MSLGVVVRGIIYASIPSFLDLNILIIMDLGQNYHWLRVYTISENTIALYQAGRLWVAQKIVGPVILWVMPNVIPFLQNVSFGLKKCYTGQKSVNETHCRPLNTE